MAFHRTSTRLIQGELLCRIAAFLCLYITAFALAALTTAALAQEPGAFRPPAVPLVTHDPYFSVWSMSDRLTDDWPRHWTGAIQAMCGMVRIDDHPYRFAGPQPSSVPAMSQTSLEVYPTRSVYHFTAGGIALDLTFMSPLIPSDPDVLALPVTYVTWDLHATDGNSHSVKLYLDCTGEWAVNKPDEQVAWQQHDLGGLHVMSIGTIAQPVLAQSGDNLRIDWGHFLLALPMEGKSSAVISDDQTARNDFASGSALPEHDDTAMPRAANDRWPVLVCSVDLGRVSTRPVLRHVLLAYDDLYSIVLMNQKLRPYWRRNGIDADVMLQEAEQSYKGLTTRCAKFDDELMTDLRRVGGERYARLMSLAYRQCLAAHKLVVGSDGEPLMFPKENFSNGCISTVDVLYPSSPFFLLFNTRLLRAQLTPVLDYAQSDRWKFPFAPHDLGTYPLANGQVYGGGEKNERDQMPVEESGNMLLMMAAMAKIDGNADFARRYWPLLQKWAVYLRDKGMDPENQLCTDDFAGHLAHNTNLSLKAILALGGYAMLCDMVGKKEEGVGYRQAAKEMAGKWVSMANDGDHYRLTFDRPGTWSQKYNLVWNRLLGLDLFSPQVAQTEIAYYRTKQNRYGLPLDNRSAYTKLDWTLWSATLAEKPGDFEALVAPLYDFANETPDRVPLTDWFWTTDAKKAGFQARSVVGGLAIKMLADPIVWQKWAARGH